MKAKTPKINPIFSSKKPAIDVPVAVSRITNTLEKAGFEAYIVGGCVRDSILKKTPKDWDVTTNATPEEIIPLFEKTFYENPYGTVGVVNEDVSDETLKTVEITPYRIESGYSDNRRPDKVTFSKDIHDDLKRRDFTINALAYNVSSETLLDDHKGQKDLTERIIRTVGGSEERFGEDALRILRAVRFHAELGFEIDPETQVGIEKTKHLLAKISKERIRDEFTKIIMSDNPMNGLIMAQKFGILDYISPIFTKTIGIEQNQAHSFDVWNHILRTLQHSADKKWPLHVRLTALLHDISKPESRRKSPEGDWTFYGHEVVGARTAERFLNDLKYPKDLVELVTKLVRWHMFFSDTEQISLSAVRRMVANVGKEYIWDLMNVRACDRIGTGRPKEDPYRLRKYKAMIEEAMNDPISVGMLKIDGKKLMEVTNTTPGPKIGYILHALLEEVIEEPTKNTSEYLENRATELVKMSENELKTLGESGKEKKEEEAEKQIGEIRKKYWVK